MNHRTRNAKTHSNLIFAALSSLLMMLSPTQAEDDTTVRVFIFAGQSNMVGSDSKVEDIQKFPPFTGLEARQSNVRFSYCIGRENKLTSDGWTDLQPVDDVVGPELSFARKITNNVQAPIAIIKVAAGGTHLGGDWNPDEPTGFQMYPLAMQWVRDALADLKSQGVKYRVEGFMWHQGENDMFNPQYMENYGKNLKNFFSRWRRDLNQPDLRFYVGELCTKTIWGMDLRPRMHAISVGQKEVTNSDALAQYIPTSHVGVEIGGGVGLHYHYGTLGQLEHGINYADAYLANIGKLKKKSYPLTTWPYPKRSTVKLFVLAGHRNMEGERAFVQDLADTPGKANLLKPNPSIAYRYNIGGGYRASDGWEPLRPAGFYDTLGPEVSFATTLQDHAIPNIAIAKFTHSGSQIIDWTPAGSEAKTRNLYPDFISFIRESIQDLQQRGHQVELTGIFYHVGENDMSWGPFRKAAPERLLSLVQSSRDDLNTPKLKWYVSQQPPTDHERVNNIDVTAELQKVMSPDKNFIHFKAFDLPTQKKQLVIDTPGIVWLGEKLAETYLND
ncbi:MAG: sialate O-acetylesterase [Fuerstiella sp.]